MYRLRILMLLMFAACATPAAVATQGTLAERELASSGVASGRANEERHFSTAPALNGKQRWRIGYYEGGQDHNYYEYLRSVIVGLMELGWLDHRDVPRFADSSTRDLWNWLESRSDSRFIEFVDDAFYSASWSNEERVRIRKRVLNRLREQDDLDLVIAMGTWAGKDLANNEHDTPTIVMSTSDPVNSGIVDSVHDSGRLHVHARVDPSRYERQIRLFHDIIGFQRLGVAYEDTPDGRAYAAMDVVDQVATEKGFDVIRCHTHSDIADRSLAGASVRRCFKRLVTEVDAIYVTLQGGVNDDTMPDLVRIANEHRIPTFSQAGAHQVRQGFLMSISRPSFRPVGMFLAATVARVLNGASPGELSQLFEESPNIAINLKTAELIGLYLYADVLAAADKLYREIDTPD